MSDRLKAMSRAVFDVWSDGNLERLDELVARRVVHHDPYDPHGADGLEGMKKSIARIRGAFPDLRLTVEDQIAEGDSVATRWRGEMTHRHGEDGTTDSRQLVTLTGITIDRFEDGVIVEAWRNMDMLGLYESLGVIPLRSRSPSGPDAGRRGRSAVR